MYKASLKEAKNVFGSSSARRKWLTKNLQNIIKLAESTGKLERVIIWGSFVSSKESPNPDLLLIMNESLVQIFSGIVEVVIDHQ